jgi:hypothetical protein
MHGLEFYLLSEDAKIVEVIDENYVVIHFYGMNILYSLKDQNLMQLDLFRQFQIKIFRMV